MSTFPLLSLDSDSIPKTSLKMCVLFSLTKKKVFLTLKILFVFLVFISSRTRMQRFDWVLLFSLDKQVGDGWTQLDTDTVGRGWTCWTRPAGPALWGQSLSVQRSGARAGAYSRAKTAPAPRPRRVAGLTWHAQPG